MTVKEKIIMDILLSEIDLSLGTDFAKLYDVAKKIISAIDILEK